MDRIRKIRYQHVLLTCDACAGVGVSKEARQVRASSFTPPRRRSHAYRHTYAGPVLLWAAPMRIAGFRATVPRGANRREGRATGYAQPVPALRPDDHLDREPARTTSGAYAVLGMATNAADSRTPMQPWHFIVALVVLWFLLELTQ